jgi:hypothetical protein
MRRRDPTRHTTATKAPTIPNTNHPAIVPKAHATFLFGGNTSLGLRATSYMAHITNTIDAPYAIRVGKMTASLLQLDQCFVQLEHVDVRGPEKAEFGTHRLSTDNQREHRG